MTDFEVAGWARGGLPSHFVVSRPEAPQGPLFAALHPAKLSGAADTRNTSVPSPPWLILERLRCQENFNFM